MKKALSVFIAVTVICFSLCSCLGMKLPSGSSSVKGDGSGTLSGSNVSSRDRSSNVDTSSNDGDLSSGGTSGISPSEGESGSGSGGASSGTATSPAGTSSSGKGPHTVKPLPNSEKWYYVNLTQPQRYIYSKIHSYLTSFGSDYIKLDGMSCTLDDITIADAAIRADFPDLFWIPGSYYISQSGEVLSIAYTRTGEDPGYICGKSEAAKMASAMNAEVKGFLASLKSGMSDYDIELAAHDWIAQRITYNHSAASDPDSHPLAFTAYGALVEGSAVCEGYAKAMKLLLNSAGIHCITVTGTLSNQGHMWNMVKVGGKWYNVDVTSDDGTAGLYHHYFNQTDEHMRGATYKFDPDFSDEILDGESFNLKRPKATATEYCYYRMTGYTVMTLSPDKTFVEAVKRAKADGRKVLEIYIDKSVNVLEFDFGKYISAALPSLGQLGITSLNMTEFPGFPRNYSVRWQ